MSPGQGEPEVVSRVKRRLGDFFRPEMEAGGVIDRPIGKAQLIQGVAGASGQHVGRLRKAEQPWFGPVLLDHREGGEGRDEHGAEQRGRSWRQATAIARGRDHLRRRRLAGRKRRRERVAARQRRRHLDRGRRTTMRVGIETALDDAADGRIEHAAARREAAGRLLLVPRTQLADVPGVVKAPAGEQLEELSTSPTSCTRQTLG